MLQRNCYILIGEDRTGKTTFQKYLIWHLCNIDRTVRLDTNLIHNITHPESPRKLKTLFTINRSIQEKMQDYGSVENYFNTRFRDADIAILSSHSAGNCITDIQDMMREVQARYYNVHAVFFSNHLNPDTALISNLNWSSRFIIDNPWCETEEWENQIDHQALLFAESLIRIAKLY